MYLKSKNLGVIRNRMFNQDSFGIADELDSEQQIII